MVTRPVVLLGVQRSPFRFGAGILLLALPSSVCSQVNDLAWADSIYAANENGQFDDRSNALQFLDRMARVYQATDDSCRLARVESWRVNCFDGIGKLDSAVISSTKARSFFKPGCDSLIWMSISVNYCNVLLSLGEFDHARSLCDSALVRWNPRWPYSLALNGLLTNRAIALANLGEMDNALSAFRKVLSNARRESVKQNEVDALLNLGAIFGMLGEGGGETAYLDSASLYMEQVLVEVKRMGDRQGMMLQYINLGRNASDRGIFRTSLAYLDSAHALASELKDGRVLSDVALVRANSWLQAGQADTAYAYLLLHLALKDSLLNIEKVKAIADVQEKYESEKKAKEILGLRADNLEGELEQARVKRTRNIFFFSAIGVVGLAIGLWSRLRFVHRSRAAIQKEKDVSEGLLLNILPEEVAEELKAKGHADVKEFDTATILFSDFKGFTQMSEKLPATELVAEIDHCFKAFDGIMGKYRIEKIKTIGDAYMAAGGLPDPANGHPLDVVLAAIEMQDFMAAYKAERTAAGRIYFEMRVGIHTGPVIAGIVGVKKFAYDIWGDTVNTASRMESSGEVGKVNISESTYTFVNGAPDLRLTARGKVQAKGKGEMEMYFAEKV